MFNIGTILIFLIGLIFFIILKKKTKNKKPLIIYVVSFLIIYIISSIILNNYLINNYLNSLENGSLVYTELAKKEIDSFEEDSKEYFCKAADYLEGTYRVMYYVLDGKEVYQPLGQGLLIEKIEDTEHAYKVQVMLRYNEILRKFFLQFHTKSYNVIYVNNENVYYLN